MNEVPRARAGAFVSARAADDLSLDLPVPRPPLPGRGAGGVLTGAVREG
ncbi:MAG: hypothetical protein NT171_20085 [Planctomycetota bacterium]|jgi:hypothetical protein|nr:hypothetical protein [Planctomycetota bacterium]